MGLNEKTIREVLEETLEERDYVIWTSPKMIEAINKAIDEELQTKYNIL